jgi:hypothetical protein
MRPGERKRPGGGKPAGPIPLPSDETRSRRPCRATEASPAAALAAISIRFSRRRLRTVAGGWRSPAAGRAWRRACGPRGQCSARILRPSMSSLGRFALERVCGAIEFSRVNDRGGPAAARHATFLQHLCHGRRFQHMDAGECNWRPKGDTFPPDPGVPGSGGPPAERSPAPGVSRPRSSARGQKKRGEEAGVHVSDGVRKGRTGSHPETER